MPRQPHRFLRTLLLALLLLPAMAHAQSPAAATASAPKAQSAASSPTPAPKAQSAASSPAPESSFTRQPIDSLLFERIRGRSYKDGCRVPLADLEYLQVLHYDTAGIVRRGELICNKAISTDLLEIFQALYEARYPIASLRLIDDYDADDERSMTANNSSCFNYRPIAGTTRLSAHSRGMAIDINPLYNPYVKRTTAGSASAASSPAASKSSPASGTASAANSPAAGSASPTSSSAAKSRLIVRPAAAAPYADRTRTFPCKIDRNDLCYRLFKAHGFIWGGSWKSCQDYQHFEKP